MHYSELDISYSIGEFLSNLPSNIIASLTQFRELQLREVLHFIMQCEAKMEKTQSFREPYSLTELPKVIVEALASQGISVISASSGARYLEWQRGFYIPFDE